MVKVLTVIITVILLVEQVWIATQVDSYVDFVSDMFADAQEKVNSLLEWVGLKKRCPDYYLIHINTLNKTKMKLRNDYFHDVCDRTIEGRFVHHNQSGVAIWIEAKYNG